MLVEQQKLKKKEVAVVSSLDVAETFGRRHADVLKGIETLECSKDFAQRNFSLSDYTDASGRRNKMYYITRDGFTLLVMGYTGEKAMKFKEAYIRQFNEMEKQLTERLIEREKGIVTRHTLTSVIKELGLNDKMHGHAYSVYTDAVYRVVFGKNAKQIREEYGVSKRDNLRDCFSAEDLQKINSVEKVVGGLMECGWGYDEIKGFIENGQRKLLADA